MGTIGGAHVLKEREQTAMKSLGYAALIVTAGLSVAVQAEDAKLDKNDPNRLICRSEEQTGTRLAKNRRCLTKAQWELARHSNRMEVEASQALRYKTK
jgi:hypothetical protein